MIIECGVPQCSILGPLLIVIYISINDLTSSTNLLSPILFAILYDTNLFFSGKDIKNLELMINAELKNIQKLARK